MKNADRKNGGRVKNSFLYDKKTPFLQGGMLGGGTRQLLAAGREYEKACLYQPRLVCL